MEVWAVKQRVLLTLVLMLTALVVIFKLARNQESMSGVYGESMSGVYGDVGQLVASQSYYNKLCELDRYTN